MTKEELSRLEQAFEVAMVRLFVWMAVAMFSILPSVGHSPSPIAIGITILGTIIGLGGVLYNGVVMADAEEQAHIVSRNVYHEHKTGCSGLQAIAVIEEKYSPTLVAHGNWGMSMYADTLCYERTQCPECGFQMVWTRSEGRKPFVESQS